MNIFSSPLGNRLMLAKSIGFIFGLFIFIMMPIMIGVDDLLLRIGIVFWYSMLGVFIGVMGILTKHPSMKFPMPFWLRGTIIGGFMNFTLGLIAHNQITEVIEKTILAGTLSPVFLLTLEGIVFGILCDGICTLYIGHGEKLLKK